MSDVKDDLDLLFEAIRSKSQSLEWSIDPDEIIAGRRSLRRRALSIELAAAFAVVMILLLVLFLTVGKGQGSSHPSPRTTVSPATRPSKTTTRFANPFIFTADPEDPGYSCKVGTANEGVAGAKSVKIWTVVCEGYPSFDRKHRKSEGPLSEGVPLQQLIKDLGWGPIPSPGTPVASSGPESKQGIQAAQRNS
jgi:hypothetical protein